MRNSPDPTIHQQLERQMMEHVERLLGDERMRVDTTRGRRLVTTMFRAVETGDQAVELKRMMSEMGKPDRELQNKMPQGLWMEVTLSQKKWFFMKEVVGKIQVVCISPNKSLISGQTPSPLTGSEVQKVLAGLAMENRGSEVPTTIVLVSTGGFTLEASEHAERRADRTLIMVQPNDAGGWKVSGPVETKALVDLFDPEVEAQKRERVRKYIEENALDMMSGGIATDKVAAKTQLPLQLVEAELKSYAKDRPGMQAKRLDGRIVLFREGVTGVPPTEPAGDSNMPFLERVKALFSRKGDSEKKIAFLSERRAALSQQQDRIYEDLSKMEHKEADLRDQFKNSTSALTKRRLTSQLLQYRKDIERRQQMLGVISQQVNVVNTHLHTLELMKQGTGQKLPNSEEITADAVKAEEMLASLQTDNEIAQSVGGITSGGLSEEEQALFEELERETEDEKKAAAPVDGETMEEAERRIKAAARAREQAANSRNEEPALEIEDPPPVPTTQRRGQAEPG